MASSTVYYKFRSSPNYETIQIQGTGPRAKLFDIKRAILKAKNLDKTGLDFDFIVKNAANDIEYSEENDEGVELRGVRLVIKRTPAARGTGLLARIARLESGMDDGKKNLNYGGSSSMIQSSAANSGFYTLENDQDEELVDTKTDQENEDAAELAAVQAATDTANLFRPGGASSKSWVAGQSSVPSAVAVSSNLKLAGAADAYSSVKQQQRAHMNVTSSRPARQADPELRELQQLQQQQAAGANQVKKRATGIPRTFMAAMDAAKDKGGLDHENAEDSNITSLDMSTVQPNLTGFEHLLKQKGGVKSSNSEASQAAQLKHALLLTNITIPEHLQCAMCHNLAKTAMFLPWDPEGRTANEECIRPALLAGGYKCPVSGIEGVSGDDLRPNIGLRKSVEKFIEDVMKEYESVLLVQEEDKVDVNGTTSDKELKKKENRGDSVSNKTSNNANTTSSVMIDEAQLLNNTTAFTTQQRSKHKHASSVTTDDDPLSKGDAFGGDVFDFAPPPSESDVANKEPDSATSVTPTTAANISPANLDEERHVVNNSSSELKSPVDDTKNESAAESTSEAKHDTDNANGTVYDKVEQVNNDNQTSSVQKEQDIVEEAEPKISTDSVSDSAGSKDKDGNNSNIDKAKKQSSTNGTNKVRRPPRGYAMGPAAITTNTTREGSKGGKDKVAGMVKHHHQQQQQQHQQQPYHNHRGPPPPPPPNYHIRPPPPQPPHDYYAPQQHRQFPPSRGHYGHPPPSYNQRNHSYPPPQGRYSHPPGPHQDYQNRGSYGSKYDRDQQPDSRGSGKRERDEYESVDHDDVGKKDKRNHRGRSSRVCLGFNYLDTL